MVAQRQSGANTQTPVYYQPIVHQLGRRAHDRESPRIAASQPYTNEYLEAWG